MNGQRTPTWRTRDGREFSVAEMSTDHIKNALAMLRRKGCVGMSDIAPYLGAEAQFAGDAAQDAINQEFDALLEKPHSPFIDIFEAELDRRSSAVKS